MTTTKNTALTNAQIDAYEAKGFRRWTKNGMDRLYVNISDLGAKITYYKTGNVHTASWCGERVSNADGLRLLGSKVWIDVTTGELHVRTRFDRCGLPSVEDAARKLMESVTEADGASLTAKRAALIDLARECVAQKRAELDAMGADQISDEKREEVRAQFDALLEKAERVLGTIGPDKLEQLHFDYTRLDRKPEQLLTAIYNGRY